MLINSLEMAVIDVLTLMPQCMLLGYYNCKLAPIQKRWIYILTQLFLLSCVAFLFDVGVISGMVRVSLIYILSMVIAALFVEKETKIYTAFIVLLHFIIIGICEGIPVFFYAIIWDDPSYTEFFTVGSLLVRRMSFVAVYAIVAQCFCYVVDKIRKTYVRQASGVFVWLTAIQLLAMSLLMGDYTGKAIQNIFNIWMIIIFCVLCVLMDVAVYVLLQEIDLSETEKYRGNQLAVQIKSQNQRQKDLQNDIIRAVQIKEKLQKRIDESKDMLLKRNDTATNDNLKILEDMVAVTAECRYCHNRVLDALLSEKAKECERKDIQIDIQLEINNEIEKDTGIQNVDLCVIVGNLLDNAIRACKKRNIRNECGKGMDGIAEDAREDMAEDNMLDSKAYIRLAARKKGKYLVFHQENTAYGEMENRRDGLLSEHGLGLEILERVAQKYHGYIEIQQDKEVFHTYVMLKMQNKTT